MIGMDDDSVGLGADSLGAPVMLAEFQGEFGEFGGLAEFFAEPSVATLARIVMYADWSRLAKFTDRRRRIVRFRVAVTQLAELLEASSVSRVIQSRADHS